MLSFRAVGRNRLIQSRGRYTGGIPGPVAQRSEQGTHNPLVLGSNPSGPIGDYTFPECQLGLPPAVGGAAGNSFLCGRFRRKGSSRAQHPQPSRRRPSARRWYSVTPRAFAWRRMRRPARVANQLQSAPVGGLHSNQDSLNGERYSSRGYIETPSSTFSPGTVPAILNRRFGRSERISRSARCCSVLPIPARFRSFRVPLACHL